MQRYLLLKPTKARKQLRQLEKEKQQQQQNKARSLSAVYAYNLLILYYEEKPPFKKKLCKELESDAVGRS